MWRTTDRRWLGLALAALLAFCFPPKANAQQDCFLVGKVEAEPRDAELGSFAIGTHDLWYTKDIDRKDRLKDLRGQSICVMIRVVKEPPTE